MQAPRGLLTRPTTDRVREAVFSSLSAKTDGFSGLRVLDAFAGSGALGLEALSRGAEFVTFIERDALALKALRANIDTLAVQDRSRVTVGDAFRVVDRGVGECCSLILLDPPYTLDPVQVSGLLCSLESTASIAEGAVVMWEHASGSVVQWPHGYVGIDCRRYGTTCVDFARYEP